MRQIKAHWTLLTFYWRCAFEKIRTDFAQNL